MEQERIYSLSARVFVFGIITTLLVCVAICTVLLVVASHSITNERKINKRMIDLEQEYSKCELRLARTEGRVQSFESVLVNPQRTAIETAVREFIDQKGGIGGSEEMPTIKDFARWIEQRR